MNELGNQATVQTRNRQTFPMTYAFGGQSVKIGRVIKTKNGVEYVSYVVRKFHLGKNKEIWRSSLEDAQAEAQKVCIEMGAEEQGVSTVLTNGKQFAYLKALESLEPLGLNIDDACSKYAELIQILEGSNMTALEIVRDWKKHHHTVLPKITVQEAAQKMQMQSKLDKKSYARKHELKVYLNGFANNFQCDVSTVTPSMVSSFLSGLEAGERSKLR
jgi:hypothetical protein